MEICSKKFITCCWLHNFLLEEDAMDRSIVRIGRGQPIEGDGIWLSSRRTTEGEEEKHHEEESPEDRELSQAFQQRRALLVNHLYFFRQKGKILEGR